MAQETKAEALAEIVTNGILVAIIGLVLTLTLNKAGQVSWDNNQAFCLI